VKVRFTPRAFSDLEDIRSYIAQFNPIAARRVVAALEGIAGRLVDLPERGQLADLSGVRVVFAVRYPYRIYYRVAGDIVDILHIRHVARKPVEEGDI
jgi:plasmid stabilization system protein ParE